MDYEKLGKEDIMMNTFICNDCGIVENCEASLKVHKRKKHIIRTNTKKNLHKSIPHKTIS